MNIQSYYQPQENGEYMYIEVDTDLPGSEPTIEPEYFETFIEVQNRHSKSNCKTPLQIIPYVQNQS